MSKQEIFLQAVLELALQYWCKGKPLNLACVLASRELDMSLSDDEWQVVLASAVAHAAVSDSGRHVVTGSPRLHLK